MLALALPCSGLPPCFLGSHAVLASDLALAFKTPFQGLQKVFKRPFQGLLKVFSRPSKGLLKGHYKADEGPQALSRRVEPTQKDLFSRAVVGAYGL
jgi:hypothetical protein